MQISRSARLLSLLSLLLLCLPAAAQKLRLSGVVTDSVTGETMPAVTVLLDSSGFGANTNLDGEYAIFAPPGSYTLTVRFSGYEDFTRAVTLSDANIENFDVQLRPVTASLDDVVITGDMRNPAHRIVRNAAKHRQQNSMDKIDAYEYESYNKLVIYMDNVTDKLLDNKVIKNVGGVVKEIMGDSTHTDTSRYKIAAFVSESISKLYHTKPDHKKEEIYAIQTSGVKGSEFNLLSSMFLQINLYDNNIVILDRQFTSPIADGALLDYDYELMTVESRGRDTLFGLRIRPRTEFSLTFEGTMYIESGTWAVTRVELDMNGNPNINFVEDVRIRQEYIRVDTFWVPSMLDLEVDFQNSLFKREGGKGPGAIGRTSSYMYDYKINQPREPKFYQQEVLEIMPDAEGKDSTFWAEKRRSPLDQSEQLGFQLVAALKERGLLDFYINAITFVTWGTKKFKYFEIGPYFYLAGFNQAEGFRTRIGIYSLDAFSKRLKLGGHIAYGFGDRQFKYMLDAKFRVIQKPRLEVGFMKAYEVEQVGFENFLNNGTSLLQSGLRRVPLTQLNYFHEHKLSVSSDLRKGLAGDFYYRTKHFLPASTFAFAFRTEGGELKRGYTISEAGAIFRISFQEKYITSGGDKLYIGTKYPIFNVGYLKGTAGFLDGDFSYQHVYVNAQNWARVGRYGWIRYQLRGGQVFGTLPYPSLYSFRGNQTWAYDKYGFNMMNYYEFIADRYATLALEWHLEGFIWNKLPLLRRLKLKETITYRAAWGTLSDDNRTMNNVQVPLRDGTFFNQVATPPDRIPYMEAGFGIGNIFKVLRIDAIWRLNYHEPLLAHPELYSNWGKRNNFGLRVDLAVRF
jgi:hypothetical protein